jgi:transposase
MYTCADVAQRYGVKVITVWDWIRKQKKAFEENNRTTGHAKGK